VPWRIDEVELIGVAIFGGIIEGDTLRLDGDTALTLQVKLRICSSLLTIRLPDSGQKVAEIC